MSVTINLMPGDFVQQFTTVVGMQYELGFKLAGPQWLVDPKVDTTSAMRDEAKELAESAGYAPWWAAGNAATDAENCKTEVVDLLHFLIQGAFREAWPAMVKFHADKLVNTDPAERHVFLVQTVAHWFTTGYSEFMDAGKTREHMGDVELTNHWLGTVIIGGPRASISVFFELADRFGLGWEELVQRYIVKNVLNHFRRAANYKGNIEGMPPYVKLWDGVSEDNTHCLRWAAANPDKLGEIYRAMQFMYWRNTGISVDGFQPSEG